MSSAAVLLALVQLSLSPLSAQTALADLRAAAGRSAGDAPTLSTPATRSVAAGGADAGAEIERVLFASSASSEPSDPGVLRRACSWFFGVQKEPRFSAFRQAWTLEFMSHPDLREIDARYYRDPSHDARRYVADVLLSANFWRMLRARATSAELGAFAKAMMSSPDVRQSARLFREPLSAARAAAEVRP